MAWSAIIGIVYRINLQFLAINTRAKYLRLVYVPKIVKLFRAVGLVKWRGVV